MAPRKVVATKYEFIPVKLTPVRAGDPVLGRKFGAVE
jgi:hypothetical protein